MAEIIAYIGESGLHLVEPDAVGYRKPARWGDREVYDYANKRGLRLVHGYETQARSWSMDGTSARVGGPFDWLKNLANETTQHATEHVTLQQYQPQMDTAKQIESLLVKAGIPDDIIPMAIAQVAFETGGFKSHVSHADNNWSGIKFINKPYQKNAVRGSKSPEGDYYAHFASDADWARDYKRILSINGDKAPIYAKDLQDFVQRLHNNHYFGADPALYYRGVLTLYKARGILTNREQIEQHPNSATAKGLLQWVEDHPGLAIGGGVVFLFLLSRIMR